MGFARLAESTIRKMRGKKEGEALGALDKIASSTIGTSLYSDWLIVSNEWCAL
jgi:hypothetical protein